MCIVIGRKSVYNRNRDSNRIIVAELNTGMFADYLQSHLPGKEILRINKVEGQPFLVKEVVDGVNRLIED